MRWCIGGFVVSVPPIGFCAVIDREAADTQLSHTAGRAALTHDGERCVRMALDGGVAGSLPSPVVHG